MKKEKHFQKIRTELVEMAEKLGNEENLNKVREMMAQKEVEETAEQVSLGSKAETGVAIDFVSEFGEQYTGTIVFKRPGIMDVMRMGGIKSEIFRTTGVQDLAMVDSTIKFMAQVLSTLKVVIVKSPDWFKDIDSVKDTDLIFHIFGKYEDWRDSFRKTLTENDVSGDSKPSE